MARQPTWDEHEAAILLDGLLAMEAGQTTREETVRRVSRILRQMAVARGDQVDERYRNENGIFLQLKSMESAYFGNTDFHTTHMFMQIVSLYRDDRNAFDELLREAKTMAGIPVSIKDDFMQYLSSQAEWRLSALTACYDEIESFCRGRKILKAPLFETTDIQVIQSVREAIEESRLFKMRHRKRYKDFVEACKYYFDYIRQGLFLRYSASAEEPDPVDAAASSAPENTSEPEETTVAIIPEEESAPSEEPTREEPGSSASEEIPADWVRFDFSNFNDFTGTVPVYCAVDGQVVEGKNWRRILGAITDLEIQKGNDAISDLYFFSLSERKGNMPYLLKEKMDGQNCIRLSNGYWINVNRGIPAIMSMIGTFCLHCGYRKEQVEFYGAAKGTVRPSVAPAESADPPAQGTIGSQAQTKTAVAADAIGSDSSDRKTAIPGEIPANWIRYDFSNSDDFAGTVPAYCAIDGQVVEGKHWSEILAVVSDREVRSGNPKISDLYTHSLLSHKEGSPYFTKEITEGRRYVKLPNGYWISVNQGIPATVRTIGAFCLHCGYSKEQVELYGVAREGKKLPNKKYFGSTLILMI